MKNKMTLKLTIYFSLALLLFSIIIGSLFMILFRNHAMDLHRGEMERRAVAIADNLSGVLTTDSGSGMMGNRHGMGGYIRFLDEIAMSDVWIVDEDLSFITSGHMGGRNFRYSDLPQDAGWVVDEVFQGRMTFSEGFSELLNTPTLTVGTPIRSNGDVIGALLLHSPVEGVHESISKGFRILMGSILIALVVAILLSVLLAVNFTNPLKRMNQTALQLAEGNYHVKTGVEQQDEIGELASSIDQLSSRLQEASEERERHDRMRQDFVANISHELRTPVTVIKGSLEALKDGVVHRPEQVKSYHEQLVNESAYLQRLVNDLLDLSKLQNVDFKLEVERVNICDVLKDVVRSGEHMAKEKDVEIQLEMDRSLYEIQGDYGRIRQMLMIILDNAIKFSPNGEGVRVTLKDGRITIRDRGGGIPKEDLPYIFQRFYRVKSAEGKKGSGLGLAIAKQIAQRHGIELSLHSDVNKGTEIQFIL